MAPSLAGQVYLALAFDSEQIEPAGGERCPLFQVASAVLGICVVDLLSHLLYYMASPE